MGRPRKDTRLKVGNVAPGIDRMASGNYRARAKNHAGKRITLGTFATLAAAKDALDSHNALVKTGVYVDPTIGADTFGQYAQRWLENLDGRLSKTGELVKPSTKLKWRALVRLYLLVDFGGLNLADIPLKNLTPLLISDWFGRVQMDAGGHAIQPSKRQPKGETAARQWLQQQGYDVPRTGRLGIELMDLWIAAGKPAPTPIMQNKPRPRGSEAAKSAYTLLRLMLNDANRQGLLPQGNPCNVWGAGARAGNVERPLITYLDEVALTTAMPDELKTFVLIASHGGLRRGEIMALRRQCVTFTRGVDGAVTGAKLQVNLNAVDIRGVWAVGTPKTRAARRIVPLDAATAVKLKAHLAKYVAPDPYAWLFTGQDGQNLLPERTLRRAWDKARREAGLKHVHLHDLRHYALTEYRRAGCDLVELAAIAGHSDLKAVAIYQHVSDDDLMAIANKLDERKKLLALTI